MNDTVEREFQRILNTAQEDIRRLIEQARVEASELLLDAQREYGQLGESSGPEAERMALQAETERKAQGIVVIADQMEEALHIIEGVATAAIVANPFSQQATPGSPEQGFTTELTQHQQTPEGVNAQADAEERLGVETLDLVVSPFTNFRTVADFGGALEALDGVKATRMWRFFRGTAYYVVDYAGIAPFEKRLSELYRFNPNIDASEPRSLRVTISLDKATTD